MWRWPDGGCGLVGIGIPMRCFCMKVAEGGGAQTVFLTKQISFTFTTMGFFVLFFYVIQLCFCSKLKTLIPSASRIRKLN
jgi:hypothetical protein